MLIIIEIIFFSQRYLSFVKEIRWLTFLTRQPRASLPTSLLPLISAPISGGRRCRCARAWTSLPLTDQTALQRWRSPGGGIFLDLPTQDKGDMRPPGGRWCENPGGEWWQGGKKKKWKLSCEQCTHNLIFLRCKYFMWDRNYSSDHMT